MFTLKSTSGNARRGELTTAHGTIQTPFFMPIATQGAIKAGITPDDVKNAGAEIILSNTFHLHIRPGEEVVEHLGGIQKFTGWNGPILTDSGGFQVFSLAKIRKITDEGVEFRAPHDGRKIFFTPEKVMQIQHSLGADIIMAFDECPALPSGREDILEVIRRTTNWAKRCKTEHEKLLQKKERDITLFGINQGGINEDLRKQSAEELIEIDFPGYAIGGLSVGEPNADMYRICEYLNPILPKEKPRYLMGVGTPTDILENVERGIDMFDCVIPTRNGRHGKVFTSEGELNIKSERFEKDESPLDSECECPACKQYSRGFLRHIFRAGEILGMRLLSLHNLYFYLKLMRSIQKAINNDQFFEFKKKTIEKIGKKV